MTIDDNTLKSLGINLDEAKSAALIQHFEETLQERIGVALFDELDDAQAEELVALQDKGDNTAITDWIKQHVPDYESIIQDETDVLLGELAESSKEPTT